MMFALAPLVVPPHLFRCQVAKLSQAPSMTDFFQDTHRVLRLLKLDLTNFHIQAIRPQLREV